jgi:hypothetical protein
VTIRIDNKTISTSTIYEYSSVYSLQFNYIVYEYTRLSQKMDNDAQQLAYLKGEVTLN